MHPRSLDPRLLAAHVCTSLRGLVSLLGLALLPCLAGAQTTLQVDDSVQTYESLSNATVTVTGKSELHLSSATAPLSGSVVHLNSNDAWVFFDKIRPATVSSTYLGQLRVNGATAVHGGNVRIVQFGMGTVVTPFTNAEQPLETFTEPRFGGASKTYGLYTYYNTASALGTMQGDISSFKLKRGFMATFATQANGSGTSKVYVAQDHDVTIANLPSSLDNAVQFVRVIPWRWVSKKGSCDVSPDVLNAAWHYNWDNNQNSTLNWEYVPIRQQRWWPSYPTNKTSVTHLLGYNEPDNPVEDSYTSLNNGSVDAAIAAWPELLATGLRVGSPAVTDGGKSWLYSFMDKANAAGLRVDYIAIHNYQCGNSAASLKSWLQDIWDRYRKPIWLTEFNNGANWTTCGDPTTDQNATVIGGFIDMMDSTPWIERYAVYSNVEWQRNMTWNASSTGANGLTPAGVVYRDQQSPIGYQQESYPLGVKRGVLRLPLDGDTRDSSGYENGGISYGVPAYVASPRGQALQLDGTRHVKLPAGLASASTAFTFAAWVYWDGGGNWQRVFDFGTGTAANLFLTPSNGTSMRFSIRNGGADQNVDTATLPVGQWTHVAVTLGSGVARLYVNGALAASNTAVTLTPAAIAPTLNYLGKSQFADPLFRGRLDDVVVADSALPPEQIAALMAGDLAPFQAHWRGDVDGAWTTSAAGDTNWSDSTGAIDLGRLPGPGTEVVFSADVSANAASTVLDADLTLGALTVKSPGSVGIGGAGNLTLGASGLVVAPGAGAVSLQGSGQLTLGASQTWQNNAAAPLTVSRVVSGPGSALTLNGSGTVALAGANTYGGGTTLASGTLALGHDSALGLGLIDLRGGAIQSVDANARTLANPITLSAETVFGGSGRLVFTGPVNAGSLTKTFVVNNPETAFNGVISGSGPRIKTGPGTLVFGGANTYTGATSVNAGTLVVNGSLAAATTVTVADGASLGGTGTIHGAVSFAAASRYRWSLSGNSATAGKLGIGSAQVTSGARIDLVFDAPGGTVDFSDAFWTQPHTWPILDAGTMSGTFALGSVSKDSAGRSLLDYGTVYLQQSGAGVALFFAPAGAEPPAPPSGQTAVSLPSAVTLTWLRPSGATTFIVKRSLNSGGPYATIATGVVDTSYTDLSVLNGTPYYYVIVAVNPNGESDPAAEIFARPHLPATIDKADNSSDLHLAGSWIGDLPPNEFDTARWSGLAGPGSVLLGADARWGGIAIGATAGPVGISSGNTLTLGSAGIDLGAATQDLAISSGLGLASGGQTWKVAAGRTLTVPASLSRAAGAALLVDKSTHAGTVAAPLALTDGILGPWAMVRSSGAASNGGSGGFTFATVTAGKIEPYLGATPLTTSLWTAPGANTVNYDISGASVNMGLGRVAKTLRYTGSAATTYTVGSGATLTVNALLNAGGGLWTYAPGVIIGSSGNNELVLGSGSAGLALTGVIANGSVPGSVVIAGPSTVTLSGNNTYTGGTIVASGKLVAPPASLNAGPVAVHRGATLTFTGSGQTSTSAISGHGAILHDTANTIVFTGDHSGFGGSFTHGAASNNTQFNSAVSGSQNATYTLTAGELIFAANGNYTVKMGALSSTAGNIRGGNSATGVTTLEVGRLGLDTSLAGNLNNGTTKVLALAKVGPGTLTLLGANTYSGGTAVNAGTLLVNGSLTGTGAMSVNSGATLAGAGSISAPVTVASGGALSPGNAGGAGSLTLSGALTLGAGSRIDLKLGAPGSSPRIALASTLSATGPVTVNVAALAGFGSGTYPVIAGAPSLNAADFVLGSVPAGHVCSLSAAGGTLSLTVVAIPAAPSGLVASGGPGSISLTWSTVPGATSYLVKRADSAVGDFAVLAGPLSATTYTDGGLADGATYYYVVSAANSAGESADSAPAAATTYTPSETWRHRHFGIIANEGDAADLANPSGDGLPNLIKYALGLDPTLACAACAPQAKRIDGRLVLAFVRDATATDVTLTVLGADSPAGPWTELAVSSGGAPFAALVDGVSVGETGSGDLRSVEVGDRHPIGDPAHPARFLRLRVQR